MEFILLLLVFIIGIVFGFLHKGKEAYTDLLKFSAIYGIVLGIIFVLILSLFAPESISIGASFLGVFGIFVTIIIFVIIFIIGAFVGDLLEGVRKK